MILTLCSRIAIVKADSYKRLVHIHMISKVKILSCGEVFLKTQQILSDASKFILPCKKHGSYMSRTIIEILSHTVTTHGTKCKIPTLQGNIHFILRILLQISVPHCWFCKNDSYSTEQSLQWTMDNQHRMPSPFRSMAHIRVPECIDITIN